MSRFKLIITPLILSAAMCLFADEVKSEKPQQRNAASTSIYRNQRGFDLAVFQFGGGLMLDLQDHVRGLGAMAWAPSYHFNSTISARWNVGFIFRNAFVKDELRVADFSLTFVEKPKFNSPLFGEIGAESNTGLVNLLESFTQRPKPVLVISLVMVKVSSRVSS